MRKVQSCGVVAWACLGFAIGCSDSSSNDDAAVGGGGAATNAGTAGEGGMSSPAGSGGAAGGSGASGSAGETGGAGGDAVGGNGGTSGFGGSGGLSAEGCPAPNATLCWDFEEGAIPQGFTAYRSEHSGELLVDTTRPHRGSYALHAKDLVGGVVAVPAVQGGPKKSITYTLPAGFGPVMWGRAYVYTTPEAPVSHAGLFNARYPRPGSSDTQMDALDWYEIASYQGTYMSIWHPPEPPGFPEWVKVSDTPVVIDAWACLEWQLDGAGGAQGQAADPRVWLDGTELLWPNEFTFDGTDNENPPRPTQEQATDFTLIETGVVMYQGLEVTTNWWIDDLAIGPVRIGCN